MAATEATAAMVVLILLSEVNIQLKLTIDAICTKSNIYSMASSFAGYGLNWQGGHGGYGGYGGHFPQGGGYGHHSHHG